MSSQPPFDLLQGEQVITSGKTTYLRSNPTNLGYNPVVGQLFVTTARIVFRSSPGENYGLRGAYAMTGALAPASYPLRRVVNCETLEKRVQWRAMKALKITFDNGGREYFALDDPDGWGQTILASRDKAPELAYTDTPHTTTGVEASQSRTILIVLGGLFGAVALCCLIAVVAGMLVDK